MQQQLANLAMGRPPRKMNGDEDEDGNHNT